MPATVVLATVVGALIGVPVMLSVVKIVDRIRVWYERQSGVPTYAERCPVPAVSPGG